MGRKHKRKRGPKLSKAQRRARTQRERELRALPSLLVPSKHSVKKQGKMWDSAPQTISSAFETNRRKH